MPRRKTTRTRFRDLLTFTNRNEDGIIKVSAKGSICAKDLYDAAAHLEILAKRQYDGEKNGGHEE